MRLLAPSLAICLQMAALYCAARAPAARGGRGWFAAGLLGGLTAIVNAPALVLLPVLAIAARRRAVWLLLGAAIAVAPVTFRNWAEGRELVLVSSNTGINLYLGNNPRYDATVGMRPGRDWQALVRAPLLHGVSGAGPASRFFVERVTPYAGRDPAGSPRSRRGSSGGSPVVARSPGTRSSTPLAPGHPFSGCSSGRCPGWRFRSASSCRSRSWGWV